MDSGLPQFLYLAIACGTWLWLEIIYVKKRVFVIQQALILLAAIAWPTTFLAILIAFLLPNTSRGSRPWE